MKISKLFHWLYAILMFLPFFLMLANVIACMWTGNTFTWNSLFEDSIGAFFGGGDIFDRLPSLKGVYDYLLNMFFTNEGIANYYLSMLLTYWTSISIIWLVFDVFMYVPLLVHRWIDKAKIE